MSLRDYFRGPLTTHELINLIVQLPPGCALDRAQRGEAAEWRVGDYIGARIANILLQANSSKRVPDSKLIWPPGTKPEPKPKVHANGEKKLGAAELDALFTGGG